MNALRNTFLVAAALGLLVLLPSPAAASDVSYVGTMTGVECAGCRRSISQALGKIPGVKTIRIREIADNQHRLTVTTDGSRAISKEEAVKAVQGRGGKESHYQLVTWARRR